VFAHFDDIYKHPSQKALNSISCSIQDDNIKYIKNNLNMMTVIVKLRLCSLPFFFIVFF